MSYFDPESEELKELASLPAGDARRRQFEENLAMAEPNELLHWQGVLHETDRLHSTLPKVDLPPGLEDRLLKIPDARRGFAPWGQINQWSWQNWLSGIAAILLLSLGAFYYMNAAPRISTLPDSFAESIADQAVQVHEMPSPLDVASNDIATVQTAMNQGKVPFPVVVLKPTGNLDLIGGGVCSISGTPAVFTRWKSGAQSDTLYQFEGKQIGVPAMFYRRLEVPTSLWHDTHHYRVVIWPGDSGKCTWALVLETENSKDFFSTAVY